MNDWLIPILSTITIAACVTIIGTWWPLIRRGCRNGFTRIHWIALGLVAASGGAALVRLYSIALRDWGAVWLRDTPVATLAVFLEMVGLLILAWAYFSPSAQKHLTPPHYKGVIAGALALVIVGGAILIF
jgi:hypothetical protein